MQIFPSAGFIWLFCWYICKRSTSFFCLKFELLGAYWSWLTFSVKSEKKLRSRCIQYFCHIFHDITETNRWAQNSSTHSHVFDFGAWVSNQQDQKSSAKNTPDVCLFCVPFLSTGPIMVLLHFDSPLTAESNNSIPGRSMTDSGLAKSCRKVTSTSWELTRVDKASTTLFTSGTSRWGNSWCTWKTKRVKSH